MDERVSIEAKFDLEAIPRENLGQVVYAQLSDALVKGRFPPNTRLTIRELASSLGTSVTPVRDAVLRLIQDEALILRSAREVRVPVLKPERYNELLKVRLRIEGLAARECALKASPDDIEALQLLAKQNDEAISNRETEASFDLNQTFHFKIAEIADVPLLHGFLHRIWLQAGPVIAESQRDCSTLTIDEHYRFVEAVRARDPDAAERAMVTDVGNGSKVMLDYLRKLNEPI
ncbi:GntR family transcriptional regulator [Paracoccus versutus]|uniref:GntR family transcriptional regulator n=1 Tax=Paracoccus versutus TaxID=34007 RepID=UPI001AA0AFB5|nr:GntR family transcriptional regulator [Paracoccus versutus]